MATRTRPSILAAPTPVVVASSTSFVVARPANLVAGDLIVVLARAQVSSATGDYTSSGWTRVGPAFVASSTTARVLGIYILRVPSDPTTLPASWTFTYTGPAGREVAHSLVLRGVDPTTPVDAFHPSYTGSNAAQATTVTTAPYSVPNDNGLTLVVIAAEFTAGQAHDTTAVASGFTQQAYTATASGTSASRTASGVYSRAQDAGTAPAFSASWAAAAGGAVQSVTFRGAEPATPVAPTGVDVQVWDGDTAGWVEAEAMWWDGTQYLSIDRLLTLRQDRITVAKWLAREYGPSQMIHRGGSLDCVEHTKRAYTNAVWLGATCLEASVWFTTDDVAYMIHNPDVGDMTNGTDTRRIDQMTSAEVDQIIVTKAGNGSGETLTRLSWLLATYGPTHIVIVEDKSYNHMTQLIALFEQYGLGDPTSRFMVKANGGGGTGHMTLPNSKGYRSWGYFYTHNATPIPPETVPAKAALYTTIGIEWDSTPAAYDAALSLGIPLIVHIVPSAAAAAEARTKGGALVGMQMSSPIAVLTPRLNDPL